MYVLLIIFAILYTVTAVLEIKSNKLQQKILEEILDFCEKSNKEQLTFIKELNNQNLKMRSREKLSIILLKQLDQERTKNKDFLNNLEFVTNNIEDKKLKELVQTSKQN